MDLGISNRLALVIGATGSTGREVARVLAHEGCRLALVARDKQKLYAVAEEVEGPALAIPADISDRTQLDGLIADLPRDIGIPDIIVHVAGGSAGIKDWKLPSQEWAKVWNLNLGAAIDINRAFVPTMISRGWGRIVHFSSNAVKLDIGNGPYASAKYALEGYVGRVGRELAPTGVLVNAVRPGPIFTSGRFMYSQDAIWTNKFQEHYVPMGRWGRGAEVADAVAFLCSQRCSYMAGAVVDVDGGMR